LLGNAIGLMSVSAMFLIACAVFGLRPHHWQFEIFPTIATCLSFGNLATYIAERKAKIMPIDHRPLTLFSRTPFSRTPDPPSSFSNK
jgi:hypothetical protein